MSNDFKRNDPRHDGRNEGTHSAEKQNTGVTRKAALEEDARLYDARGVLRTTAQELEDHELEQLILVSSRAWSGDLPHPQDFNAYSPEAQAKIIEWSDRGYDQIDESLKLNRILGLGSIGLVVVSVGAALVVAFYTKDPLLVGLFLAPQLFGYVSKMIRN